MWGPILWEIWQGVVRPRFLPRQDIEEIAIKLQNAYGDDAYHNAKRNEDRAWRYGEAFEQGKWRRVAQFLATLEDDNP
mgnify:CR=1 FL=1